MNNVKLSRGLFLLPWPQACCFPFAPARPANHVKRWKNPSRYRAKVMRRPRLKFHPRLQQGFEQGFEAKRPRYGQVVAVKIHRLSVKFRAA